VLLRPAHLFLVPMSDLKGREPDFALEGTEDFEIDASPKELENTCFHLMIR
jgi:hypothetical protein